MALGDEGALERALSSAVGAIVRDAGYDLEELTVRRAGGRHRVNVIIDRDGGVDLDAAAAVSRRISDALDDGGDAIFGGAPYTLEVTSPGVGRPLTQPRHFRRATGRMVRLIVEDGREMRARVARVDDDTVTVLAGPDGLDAVTLRLADIRRATVEVEFRPPSAAVTARLAELSAPPASRADHVTEREDAR